ncbi:MAG TPA: glycoside hydrolase family 43 protein [Acidimicrobiales bacterium]|nr:glycoside hydrolase family 43 protein [Acidimicrobiales bacterium]
MARARGRRRLARPFTPTVAGAGRLGIVAVVAGSLLVGMAIDAQAQLRLHQIQGEVSATRSLAERTAALAAATGRSIRRTDGQSALVESRLSQVSGELSAARALVARAKTGVASSAIQVGVVHACAAGVERSAAALAAGHQAQAVADLSSVSSVCQNALGTRTGGPVYPFDFADPDVIAVKGGYEAYATNATAGNIQIMRSTDLVHWEKAGNALPSLASWARPGSTWAPAVIHLRRSYLLYYTAAVTANGIECLSVATSRRPQGPFVDGSRSPLVCQTDRGGSIDPSPYLDPSGHAYLTWKSNGGHGQPSTLWAQALDSRGTALVGAGPTALLTPVERWEGSVVEAPTMMASGSGFLLFYSGNNWDSADYAVGVARCGGPLGPCVRLQAGPLLGSQPAMVGPGGESVFTDGQGHLQMAFAAWLAGAVGYPHDRLLFIRPLSVTGDSVRLG